MEIDHYETEAAFLGILSSIKPDGGSTKKKPSTTPIPHQQAYPEKNPTPRVAAKMRLPKTLRIRNFRLWRVNLIHPILSIPVPTQLRNKS